MAIGHTYKEFKASLARITAEDVITQITPLLPSVTDMVNNLETGIYTKYTEPSSPMTGDLFQMPNVDNLQQIINSFYAMKLVEASAFGYYASVVLDADYQLTLYLVQHNRNSKGNEVAMGYTDDVSTIETKLILSAI